jgi:TetR/AcrR family tetracycline transcriptional repressor
MIRSAKRSPRKSKPVVPLTRAAIVEEALRLLENEGLDGVNLRALATRLGVKAPSLYWHFSDKADLLAGMTEFVFLKCLDSVPAHREWPQWMRGFGKALWQGQCRTRDFTRLISTANLSEEYFRRIFQRIQNSMAHLDLPMAEAMSLQSSIQALVTGWAVYANAPYAAALETKLDFETELMTDMNLLIDGESLRLRKVAAR